MSFLTIGTYDGVHLGHQKILRTLIREGLKGGIDSALAYFPFPPRSFFSGETVNCLITLPEEREERLHCLHIEKITKVPFDSVLSEMSAEKFFNDIILKAQSASGLYVGQDFTFGYNRGGNTEFLRKHCAAAGIRFRAMPFVTLGGHKISSSLIRTFLRNGRVDAANKCLGWNYTVSGKVVKGAGIGRSLGFPTANIDAHPAKILPPGIFAARVRLDRKTYYGVVNVGHRPTVNNLDGRLILEVHILDFDLDIYGRVLEVEFLRHLRPEKRFGSREALQRQILQDIKVVRKLFNNR